MPTPPTRRAARHGSEDAPEEVLVLAAALATRLAAFQAQKSNRNDYDFWTQH